MKITSVPPSSTSNSLVNPGNSFVNRKDNFLTRCSILGTSRKQVFLSHRYTLPMSTSVRLFPQFRTGCALQPRLRTHIISATDTDIAVEETNVPAADEDSGEVSENPPPKSDASPAPAQSKRSRPVRKSEMPPVKNEDLIPGATFVGKVRSIQPFGAFVDFGAFTDGLVHVSRLSDGFVKDVGDVVSIEQEVTVKLVEANTETGRISLTMRLTDDGSKTQKQKDPSTATSRAPRKSNQKRDEVKKSSKFVKGQELEGTVKNLVRAGAFISLPDGEEGFLPASEESDDIGSLIEGSSLQIGQEVKVRVLNISRGKVQLTMKKEETSGEFEMVQGVVHTATNPFVLAFQRNKDIAAYLDEREKLKEKNPTDQLQENVLDLDSSTNVVDKAKTIDKSEDQESLVSDSPQDVDNAIKSTEEEQDPELLPPEDNTSAATDMVDDTETVDEDKGNEDILAESSPTVDSALKSLEEEPTNQLQENVVAVDTSANVVDNVETIDKNADQESLLSESPQHVDTTGKSIDQESESESLTPENITSAATDVVDDVETFNEDAPKEDLLADSSQYVDGASGSLGDERTDQLQENVVDVDASTNAVYNGETTHKNEDQESLLSDSPQDVDSPVKSIGEESESEISTSEGTTSAATDVVDDAETRNEDDSEEDILADSLLSVDGASKILDEEPEASADALVASASMSNVDHITELLPATEHVENSENSQLSQTITDQSSSPVSLIVEYGADGKVEDVTVKDEVQTETPIQEKELLSAAEEVGEPEVLNLETNGINAGSGARVHDASSPESMGKGLYN